jgi:hypothetical protein
MRLNQILLAAALICALSVQSTMAWTQDKFMILTFWDPCLTNSTQDWNNSTGVAQDKTSFSVAKTSYFNMLTCSQDQGCIGPINWDPTGLKTVNYDGYIASLLGLNYSAFHGHLYLSTVSSAIYQPITNNLLNTISLIDPGRRNAISTYFVGDEPHPGTNSTYTCDWIAKLRELDPTRLAYINLLASYAFRDANENVIVSDWESYVNAIVNNSDVKKRPDVISIDHYAITTDRGFSRTYFYDLNSLRTKSITLNKPFWWYMEAVQTSWCLNQTEGQLRFLAFCPVAYGAKGLGYFTFEKPNIPVNEYSNPLWDFDLPTFPLCADPVNPRCKLDVARENNRYITYVVGPKIMESNNVGVYHKSVYPTNQNRTVNPYPYEGIPSSQLLPNSSSGEPILRDLSNSYAMAGVFQDKVNQKVYYVFVVNKNYDSDITCNVVFKNDRRGNVYLYPRAFNYDGSTAPASVTVDYSGGYSTLSNLELKAGEGRLIKVVRTTGSTVSGFRPQGEIATGQNSDGRIICFARGDNNDLYYKIQNASDVDYWTSSWTSLGGPITGNIAVGKDANGALYVYSKNASNYLVYKKQTTPGGAWSSSWTVLNSTTQITSEIAALNYGKNKGKQIIVVVQASSTYPGYFYQTSENGSFTGNTVGTNIYAGQLAGGFNPSDSSVDLFYTSPPTFTTKSLYRIRYYKNGANWVWNTTFSNIGGTADGNIAVASNADNSLEAYITSNGYLYYIRQSTPGSTAYGAWKSIYTGTASGAMAVAKNFPGFPGTLEVIFKDNNGWLKHIYQGAPNGNYGSVCPFENGTIMSEDCISAINGGSGRIFVFASGKGNSNIFYSLQTEANNWWDVYRPFTNN